MRRQTALIGVAAISAGLLTATWFFPVFWMVFVVPCISLIAFQWVALSGWRHKEVLFKYTDYAYYLLIGTIVGLGSRYLDQRELIEQFEKGVEATNLERNLERLDAELSRLRDRLKSAKPTSDETNTLFAAMCIRERALKQDIAPRPQDSPGILSGACDDYFSSLIEAAGLPDRIAAVEREHQTTRQQLTNIRVQERDDQSSSAATSLRAYEVMFIWFPTLLLFGVTLKLGKTTNALFPIS